MKKVQVIQKFKLSVFKLSGKTCKKDTNHEYFKRKTCLSHRRILNVEIKVCDHGQSNKLGMKDISADNAYAVAQH